MSFVHVTAELNNILAISETAGRTSILNKLKSTSVAFSSNYNHVAMLLLSRIVVVSCDMQHSWLTA